MHQLSRICIPSFCFAVAACTLEKQDGADEYREAIPRAEAVSVDGPAGTAAGSLETAAGSRGALALGGTEPARWYRFTRDLRDGVNGVTAAILGSVAWVVHTEPTEVEEGKAVWGPYPADGLEPTSWRLTVTRIEARHYRYVLEGRPKASSAEADFLPVLEGDGYGRRSERHGDGSFVVRLDNARRLDPSRHADDSGTLRIEHDLPRDISRHLGALPRFITADITPEGGHWVSVTSSAFEDGTGAIDVSGLVDIDDAGTAAEDVAINSRWLASGAGRSDIGISGGDLPAEFSPATATECWGEDFSRVYYESSFEEPATEGDSSACVYAAPAD
jgi:hypothetical protein